MRLLAAAGMLSACCALAAAGQAPVIYDACEALDVSERCGVRLKGVCETAGSVAGGYHVDGSDYLLIPFTPRPGTRPYETAWQPFSGARGSVTFCFQPAASGYVPEKGILCAVSAGWRTEPYASSVVLAVERHGQAWTYRSVMFADDGACVYGGETTRQWQPGEWLHLGLHWDIQRNYVTHTLNGRGPDKAAAAAAPSAPLEIEALGPDISIGGAYGALVVPGKYDEISVYDAPAAPAEPFRPPAAPLDIYSARMLYDCLEDKVWSAYRGGQAAGEEFAAGLLNFGYELAAGRQIQYHLRQPDDCSRGPYQAMLPDAGTLSFFVKPQPDATGALVATPLFSVSLATGRQVQIEAGGNAITGPALPADAFTHLAIAFDAAHGRLRTFVNGAPAGDYRQAPWGMQGAFQVLLGGQAAPAVVDELVIHEAMRADFPEAAGVLFYASFDRPGCFADFARGRIEALGRPVSGAGRWGRGFVSGRRSLLRYPYHLFYRVGQDETTAVNAFQGAGSVSVWFQPAAVDAARKALLYLRGHGLGRDAWSVYLEAGRPVVQGPGLRIAADAPVLAAGQWYHLCLAYDEAGAVLYVDGQPAAQAQFAAARPRNAREPLPYNAYWALGAGESAWDQVDGVFDELLVLAQPLAAEQVRALYKYYVSQAASGPLRPWQALRGR